MLATLQRNTLVLLTSAYLSIFSPMNNAQTPKGSRCHRNSSTITTRMIRPQPAPTLVLSPDYTRLSNHPGEAYSEYLKNLAHLQEQVASSVVDRRPLDENSSHDGDYLACLRNQAFPAEQQQTQPVDNLPLNKPSTDEAYHAFLQNQKPSARHLIVDKQELNHFPQVWTRITDGKYFQPTTGLMVLISLLLTVGFGFIVITLLRAKIEMDHEKEVRRRMRDLERGDVAVRSMVDKGEFGEKTASGEW